MLRYLVVILLLVGCKEESSKDEKKIAATYDGGSVSIEEIDNYIKDELYEQLYAVYYLRNVSLDEVLVNKLFLEEAKKQKIDVKKLLDKEVYNRLSIDGLSKFRKKMNIDSLMQDPKNPFGSINVETEDGKKRLWERYKKTELANYGTKLMKIYGVHNVLIPPLPPKSNLDSIAYVSSGNPKSSISFWVFSDFDCSSCKAAEPVLESIYQKYNDKIEFRYTGLTDVLSFSTIACECAGKQGEFKSIHDYMFKRAKTDSTSIMAFMSGRKIDFNQFISCVKNRELKSGLVENLNRVKKLGILQTPSIYIDGRTYYGQITEDQLSLYIDNILSKN